MRLVPVCDCVHKTQRVPDRPVGRHILPPREDAQCKWEVGRSGRISFKKIRAGTDFTGYISPDGLNWTPVLHGFACQSFPRLKSLPNRREYYADNLRVDENGVSNA